MSNTGKRFEGETREWRPERNFGFLDYRDAHGRRQSMFYSGRNVVPDWKGSRAWAFGPRVPVSFLIKLGANKSFQSKERAEDVTPIFPMSEPEADLAAYRETSEISKKTYDYAFLKRPCGDEIFVHVEDVLEQYKNRWSLLEVGSPVYHGVRFDEATKRWRSTYVELYSYEELQSFKVETEPEPEPEPTLAEPVLIFAPANRVKTFHQLALERKLYELPQKVETKP